MDFSLDHCQSTAAQDFPVEQRAPGIVAATENLAGMLVETPELQAFLRLGREVRLNQEVGRINSRLNHYPIDDVDDLPSDPHALEEMLEALPVVQAYRQAEADLRALLIEVNQAISVAAGVSFAVNAKPSACT